MSDDATFTMPSSPADRKKIKDMLHEMAGMLQEIADKREDLKGAAGALEADFQIPKKISSKMARVLLKKNYHDVYVESEQLETIFETLFQGSDNTGHADIPDDDADEE